MAKYKGIGVTLTMGNTSDTNYAAVAQVRDIAGPSAEAADIDITSRDSTGNAMEFLAGLINGGEVTLDVVYDPGLAGHDTLSTMFNAGTEVTFRLTYPAATDKRAVFDGYLKAFQPQAPLEDRLSANITIKVTGPVTWHEAVP